MNRLDRTLQAQVVSALVEGNGLRATARMTGVARMTIEKLLRDLGTACAQMQDAAFRDLKSQRIECDEIWAFCGAKEKNASAEKKAQGWGDVWTWTAIDSDSKLILSWLVGKRDAACAHRFMTDVASRLRHRVQLTTDGFKAYFDAVEDAFLGQVDYAILQKIYGTAPTEAGSRYSPAQCMGIKLHVMNGDPDPSLISTSYVERSNLTMRMHMRRFTRLTNGHSKKVENHAHAVALHFAYYNFVKIHQTLRTTPAMAAGVTNRLWEIEDLLALLD